jgi:chromosome segregation ATPase
MQELRKAHAEAEAKHEELRQGASTFDEQVAGEAAKLGAVKAEIAALSGRVSAAKDAEKALAARFDPLRRDAQRAERDMAAAASAAADVAQDAMLASVDLCADGGGGAATGPSEEAGVDGEPGGVAPMELDLPDGTGTLPRSLAVDTARLPAAMRRAVGGEAHKARAMELQRGIDELAARLEDTAPNLKAPEEYVEVLEQEKELLKARSWRTSHATWSRRRLAGSARCDASRPVLCRR